MGTSWYTHIIGVVIGAAVGAVVGAVSVFLLSHVRSEIEKHRNHLAFRRILKSEIDEVTLRLMHHRNICVKCMNDITERRLHPQSLGHQLHKMLIYSSEYPTAMFSGNLDKLTYFPGTMVQSLVSFYAKVEECRSRMADLKRENPPDRYVSPKLLPAGPVTGHPDLLRKADLLLTSAVQKGEALRKEFDKDIDQEWNFGDILKILKKDALNILKKPFKTSS